MGLRALSRRLNLPLNGCNVEVAAVLEIGAITVVAGTSIHICQIASIIVHGIGIGIQIAVR